jgi:N-acetylglucosaminyldiphosphoundecaprenol N-acetyl-beta-D-mannosaminyltransferase
MKEIVAFKIRLHPLRRTDFKQIIEKHLETSTKIIIQHGINAASIIEVLQNVPLIEVYNSSDLVNIDGFSMVWGLRFLGFKVPERVACPDLANDLLGMAEENKYSIFLFGTTEANLQLAVLELLKKYPKLIIAGYRNGYYSVADETEIVKMINEVKPDIILMGMPSPKKELFAYKYKSQLCSKYIFGVGGYFDIISGKFKRAPLWVQRIGMEWFYRFAQEPKRMWRRYLIGNFKFVLWIVIERIKISFRKKV